MALNAIITLLDYSVQCRSYLPLLGSTRCVQHLKKRDSDFIHMRYLQECYGNSTEFSFYISSISLFKPSVVTFGSDVIFNPPPPSLSIYLVKQATVIDYPCCIRQCRLCNCFSSWLVSNEHWLNTVKPVS